MSFTRRDRGGAEAPAGSRLVDLPVLGFDPARERAILGLAEEALERGRSHGAPPEELVATASAHADTPLQRIGRERLLELAGQALRLGEEAEPNVEVIARSARGRAALRAAGNRALSVRIEPIAWEAATSGGVPAVGFRAAALGLLEAITVAWPPPGAARVWHPARPQTVEQVQKLAARALAGPAHVDPGELLELTEWEEAANVGGLPEDLLADALHAYAALPVNGVRFALARIVECCAGITRLVNPDAEGYQIGAVAQETASVIDGAGFAGGANTDLDELISHLLGDLAAIPGGLGRFARDPDRFRDTVDVLAWPAGAARRGLLAMWLHEQAKPRG